MKNRSWTQVLWPVLVLGLFVWIVLTAHKGMDMDARAPMLDYLPHTVEETNPADAWGDVAVVYAPQQTGEQSCVTTLMDTLEEMRIPFRMLEIDRVSSQALADLRTVLICTQDISPLIDQITGLIGWVEQGGRLGFMMAIQNGDAFDILNRKLGIMEHSDDYVEYTGLRFTEGTLPLWSQEDVFTDNHALSDFAMTVRLEPDCQIYMQTAGETETPLLWARDLGEGRLAVYNATLTQDKGGRGFALAAIAALCDPLVYPIINAGMVFIDDFPAPQPEGADAALMEQYGYDIQGFFRNHWWPDMKALTWDDGLRYTGVLVETYNDLVEGPFAPDGNERALVRYYASELLQSGGELGQHRTTA